MAKAISLCLLIVGLINFAPVLAIVSAQKLENAYGVALLSNDLINGLGHILTIDPNLTSLQI